MEHDNFDRLLNSNPRRATFGHSESWHKKKKSAIGSSHQGLSSRISISVSSDNPCRTLRRECRLPLSVFGP